MAGLIILTTEFSLATWINLHVKLPLIIHELSVMIDAYTYTLPVHTMAKQRPNLDGVVSAAYSILSYCMPPLAVKYLFSRSMWRGVRWMCSKASSHNTGQGSSRYGSLTGL